MPQAEVFSEPIAYLLIWDEIIWLIELKLLSHNVTHYLLFLDSSNGMCNHDATMQMS